MTDFDAFIENILEQGLFSRLANKFKKNPAPEAKPYKMKADWGKGRTHFATKPSPPTPKAIKPEKEWGKGKTHFAVTPSSPNPEPIKPNKEWGAGRTHFAVKPKQLPSVPKISPIENRTTKSGTEFKAKNQFMVKPMPKLPSKK
jgi:hypothetical protein